MNSGSAALKMDGSHVVADENACEVPTPFGLRAIIPREELVKERIQAPDWPGQFPLDREVIEYLRQHLNTAGAKSRVADNVLPLKSKGSAE